MRIEDDLARPAVLRCIATAREWGRRRGMGIVKVAHCNAARNLLISIDVASGDVVKVERQAYDDPPGTMGATLHPR